MAGRLVGWTVMASLVSMDGGLGHFGVWGYQRVGAKSLRDPPGREMRHDGTVPKISNESRRITTMFGGKKGFPAPCVMGDESIMVRADWPKGRHVHCFDTHSVIISSDSQGPWHV